MGKLLAQDGTFYLVDVETKESVSFTDIFDKYHLNKENPTLMILWSIKWCSTCTDLIERYALSNVSKFNLILINVDRLNHSKTLGYSSEEALFDDLKQFKSDWDKQNVVSFYGYSSKGGIEIAMGDSVQQVPRLVYFTQDMKPLVSQVSLRLYPWVLFDNLYKKEGLDYYASSPDDVIDAFLEAAKQDTISIPDLKKRWNKYLNVYTDYYDSYFFSKHHSYRASESDIAYRKLECSFIAAYYNDKLGDTMARDKIINSAYRSLDDQYKNPIPDGMQEWFDKMEKLKHK